jgi:hypothetical protein
LLCCWLHLVPLLHWQLLLLLLLLVLVLVLVLLLLPAVLLPPWVAY